MKENTSLLTDLSNSVSIIASSMLDDSMKLKDAKSDLTLAMVQLNSLNPYFDNGVCSLMQLACKVTKKADMENYCRSILGHWGGIQAVEGEAFAELFRKEEGVEEEELKQVDSSVGDGLAKFAELNSQPVTVEQEIMAEMIKSQPTKQELELMQETGEDEDQPTSFLEELAIEIKYELESATRSFLKVGQCLNEASTEIKEGGGNQAKFIQWADENCGIKKAQAYKLMSVFKSFGADSDFNGVSMRVLYTLTGQCPKVVDLARAKAKTGTLDTKALDIIIEAINGPKEKKEPATPKTPATPETPKAPVTPPSVDKAKDKEIEELKAALKTEKQMRCDAVDAALDAAGPVDENETIKALQDTIRELNETITSLRDDVKSAKNDKPVPSSAIPMPELPQFDSASLPCRLGLEMEFCEDKIKINKAYRSLAKIFTAANNPEAASKIKEARERLLKSAK